MKKYIVIIILLSATSCVQEVNDFMWGKQGTPIIESKKSCAENVKNIHVPYDPEPTVCNHEFHYSSQLMCLPKVCLDSDMIWTIRREEIKDKLYEQYLKTHNR